VGHDIFPIRNLFAVGESAPDVVLKRSDFGSSICKIFSLSNFDFYRMLRAASCKWFEEVCDGVDCGGALSQSVTCSSE
jgi:hypothetical protein